MNDPRAERRAADLLPEERAAGSADPEAQAEAILEESDERERRPSLSADEPGVARERRTSPETVSEGETVNEGEGTR